MKFRMPMALAAAIGLSVAGCGDKRETEYREAVKQVEAEEVKLAKAEAGLRELEQKWNEVRRSVAQPVAPPPGSPPPDPQKAAARAQEMAALERRQAAIRQEHEGRIRQATEAVAAQKSAVEAARARRDALAPK